MRIVQRKRLADKAGGVAEQMSRYRIKLLPVFVLLASVAALVYLRVQPKASKQISRVVELSSGEVSRLSFLWSPLAGMIAITVAALMYMWMDYQHHKKPLIRVAPKTKYGFLHHLRTTFLPRFKYRWRPAFYWLAVAVVCATAFITTVALVGVPSAKAFSGDGLGTEETPYIITSCEQLQEMRDDLAGHYELGGPIDCTDTNTWNGGAGFQAIANDLGASSDQFTGSLDGKGFAIDGLYQRVTGEEEASSMMGLMVGATVKDLQLTNVDMANSDQSEFVAALAYGAMQNSQITDVSTSGVLAATSTERSAYVSGLVGALIQSSITRASVDVTITNNAFEEGTNDIGKGSWAAGIAVISQMSTITNSYSKGSITGTFNAGQTSLFAGGITGQTILGSITNSYSGMAISVTRNSNLDPSVQVVGGLTAMAGAATINNSFATGQQTISTGSMEINLHAGLVGIVLYSPDEDPPFNADIIGSQNYIDASRIGASACVGGYSDGDINVVVADQSPGGFCSLINVGNSQPNYFFNNSTSPPFNVGGTQVWDFTDVWKTVTASTPIFSSQAPGVPSLPGQVRNLTTSSSNETSLTAQWLAPLSNGNSPITNYVVQYKLHSAGSWTGVTRGSPTATSQLITGLTAGQMYDVRVAAVNAVGQSDWLVTENVQTSQVPSAPRNVVVSGVAQTGEYEPFYFPQLDWQAPEIGTPFTDYVIQYKVNSGSDWDATLDELQDANLPWVTKDWVTATDGTNTTLSFDPTQVADDDLMQAIIMAIRAEANVVDSIDFRIAAVNSHGQGPWSGVQNFQVFIGITACQQMHDTLDQYLGSVFHLLNNIDCNGTRSWNGGRGWNPVGDNGTPFQGIFDGEGYAITDLYINDTNQDSWQKRPSAMFGGTDGATIRNLNMTNVDIANWYPTDNIAAALIALASPSTVLTNIHASGTIKSQDYAAGLVGGVNNYNNETYTEPVTWSDLDFTGTVTTPGFAGGVAGIVYAKTARFALEDVHTDGTLVGGRGAGGIIAASGATTGPGLHITDAHSTMDIESRCRDGSGGLIGAASGAVGAVMTVANSSYDGDISCTGDNLPFFNYPTALAFNSSGELFITDTTKTGNIHKLSSSGDVLASWSTARPGDPTDDFYTPDTNGLVVDSQGWSYLADVTNGEIRIYNAAGQFQDAWTTPVPGQLAIDSGNNIYVTSGYQIRKYSQSGVLLDTWGEQGSGPEQFGSLTDIAIAPNGNIIVVDGQNHCLHVLLSNGDYDQKITTDGVGAPPMTQSAPQSVTVDAQGKVYVLETDRVKVFDSTYNFLEYWGVGGVGDAVVSGYDIVAVPNSGIYVVGRTIRHFDNDGSLDGEWGGYVLGTPGDSYSAFAGGVIGGVQGAGFTITDTTSAGHITLLEGTGGGLVGFGSYVLTVDPQDPETSADKGVVIDDSSSSMDVAAGSGPAILGGGLVGAANVLDINHSHASGDIIAGNKTTTSHAITGAAGGLVGQGGGSSAVVRIRDSYATGAIQFDAVSPESDTVSGPTVGGAIGFIAGWSKLDGVHASGAVTVSLNDACQAGECDWAAARAGGLVGLMLGPEDGQATIPMQNVYATGAITSSNRGSSTFSGGLIGDITVHTIHLQNAYATGTVTTLQDTAPRSGSLVGGLLGNVAVAGASSFQSLYATGTVSGSANYRVVGVRDIFWAESSGGLIGSLTGPVMLQKSYATGNVTGGGSVGGLIGSSLPFSISDNTPENDERTIQNTYATGTVTAFNDRSYFDEDSDFGEGYVEFGTHAGGLIGVAVDTSVQKSYASGVVSNEHPEFNSELPVAYMQYVYGASTGGLIGRVTSANPSLAPEERVVLADSFSAATLQDTTDNVKGLLIGEFWWMRDPEPGSQPELRLSDFVQNSYYDSYKGGNLACTNELVPHVGAQPEDLSVTVTAMNDQSVCKAENVSNQAPNYFKNSTTSAPLNQWDFSSPVWYSHVTTYPTFQQGESVPGPPRNLAGTPTTSSVALSWQAPSSDGGSPIVDYRVQYRVHGTNTWTEYTHPVSTATAYTITGLIAGTSYDFQVSAINAVGQSTWVLGIYDVLVPAGPTNPTNPTTPTSPSGPTRPTTRPPTGGTTTSSNGGSPTQEDPPLLDISKIPETELPRALAIAARKTKVSRIPYFFLSWLLLLAAYYAYRAVKEYRYQKAAAALIERTTKTEKSVSEFLAITTHYLGTPLSILKGAMELIASKHTLQAEFMAAFNTKLTALQTTADTLTAQNEQALSANQAVVADDVEQTTSAKWLWLSMAGIALGIAVTDVILMLSKSYDQPWGRTLNHAIWAVLGSAIVAVSFVAWSKQKKLRTQYHQTLARERALLEQKNAFLGEAAQQLTTHAAQLRQGTQGLEQFPDTKLLMNGLAMLDKVALALGKVQQFGAMNDSSPNLNVKQIFTRDIAPALTQEAQVLGVRLNNRLTDEVTIQMQPEELQQVLGSVTQNAVQFSTSGGTVNVGSETGRSKSTIIVQDDGKGIALEAQQHLFEPLTRGVDTATFDHEGLGLNLFITRMILQKHGGDITIASKPQQGTTVTMQLPKSGTVATGMATQVISPSTS